MPLPNDPVQPTFATMEWVRTELNKFKMQVLTAKRGPKRWPRGGGGGASNITTNLAVVHASAAPITQSGTTAGNDFKLCNAGNDIGECVLLKPDTAMLNSGGFLGCLELASEGGNLEDFLLPLRNPYEKVPLTAGSIVQVSPVVGTEVTQGGMVVGWYINPDDYRRAKESFIEGQLQGEYHEAGSSEIIWGQTEC